MQCLSMHNILHLIETYELRILFRIRARFIPAKVLCMKPCQTQDTWKKPRGAMFCQEAYFTTSKMPCSCQNLQGEFCLLCNMPSRFQGHLGILSLLLWMIQFLFNCIHHRDTGDFNILFLCLIYKMPYTVKSPISKNIFRNKIPRTIYYYFCILRISFI